METIVYIAGSLCLIATIIAGMFGALGHRSLCIWTSGTAILFAVLTGCCWLQDREWKKDAPQANRPSLFLTGVSLGSLVPGQQLSGTMIIQNLGKSDAIDVEQESALITRTEKLTSDPPPLSRDSPPVKTMIPAGLAIKMTALGGPPLTADAIAKIVDKKLFVYVYGVVHYYSHELPKEEQTMKFCALYDPAVQDFKQTSFHNSTH
ncbi:MAG: hypothetical protein DME97_16305 [Verrucomicrobia bacterium]|nr:MAG: hypothetical protein DME97_16305 [Verrucomicrobiota bacterium]